MEKGESSGSLIAGEATHWGDFCGMQGVGVVFYFFLLLFSVSLLFSAFFLPLSVSRQPYISNPLVSVSFGNERGRCVSQR